MKSTFFKATGMNYYIEAINNLRIENEDYNLPRLEMLESFGPGAKVWKYEYIFDSVELIPEPDNPYDKNAVAVYADGKMIAHIKRGSCSQVKNLINADDFIKVEAEIGGGPYKYIFEDDEGNLFIDKNESEIFVHLTIYNDRPTAPPRTEEPAIISTDPADVTVNEELAAPEKRSAIKTISIICGIVLLLLSVVLLLVDVFAFVPLVAGFIAIFYGIRK